MKLLVAIMVIVAIAAGAGFGRWFRTADSPQPVAKSLIRTTPTTNPFAFPPGESPSYGNMTAQVVAHECLDPEGEG